MNAFYFTPLQPAQVISLNIADFPALQPQITRPVCQDCQRFSVPVYGFPTPCTQTHDGAHRNIVNQPVPRAHVASMLFAAYRSESPIVNRRLAHYFVDGTAERALLNEGIAQSHGNARK